MNQEVTSYITDCRVCQESRRTKQFREAPICEFKKPNSPWGTFSMDLVGPFNYHDFRFLLVVIDQYSSWVSIFRLFDITAKTIVEKLDKLFKEKGCPKSVLSDNGTQFVSSLTQKFFSDRVIRHCKTPIYFPEQNELVERMNGSIKRKLEEMQELETGKWNKLKEFISDCRVTHT